MHRMAAGAALFLVVSGASAAGAVPPVFKLADDSSLIVRGTVENVASHAKDAFQVFTIRPNETLKGKTPDGAAIQLVEERVFGSERPYFAPRADVLLLASPLPEYSYYRASLPQGPSYLRWTSPKDSAAEVGELQDPAVLAAVRGYLAAGTDAAAVGTVLAKQLATTVPRLRGDALATIVARQDVAATLDVAALEPLRRALADERIPAAERSNMLIRLARAGAPGVGVIAEEVAAQHGPLEPAAIDALIVAGRAPNESALLAASRSESPALRAAAVRGLAQLSSRAAFERIAEIVRHDPSSEVRVAALSGLAVTRDPRAVEVLAGPMRGDDEAEIRAASDALARIATPEAVRVLGEALRTGTAMAAASAAFALKMTNTAEGEKILREQRDANPDPHIRRAIKLALGEHIEEHEDE